MKNTEMYEGNFDRMLILHYLDIKLFLIIFKNTYVYKSLPLVFLGNLRRDRTV